MNLNLLLYLWHTVREGSVSAAARRMGLTQSTVSIQLNKLEAELGRRLLERGRGGIRLTAHGRLAMEHCERICREGAELKATFDGEPGETPVRLGASHGVPHQRLLQAAEFTRRRLPGVPLRFYSGAAGDLAARLRAGSLDLLVSDADLAAASPGPLTSRRACIEHMDFLAAPQVRDAMGAFPAGLSKIPLLLRAPGDPVRHETERFLQRHGIRARVHAELESPDLIRSLALLGEGAGVMNAAMAAEPLAKGQLVKLNDRPTGIRRTLWLVRQRAAPLSRDVAVFLEAAMKELRF